MIWDYAYHVWPIVGPSWNYSSLGFLLVHGVCAAPAVVEVAVAAACEVTIGKVDFLATPIAEQAPASPGLTIAQDSSFWLGAVAQSVALAALLRA